MQSSSHLLKQQIMEDKFVVSISDTPANQLVLTNAHFVFFFNTPLSVVSLFKYFAGHLLSVVLKIISPF